MYTKKFIDRLDLLENLFKNNKINATNKIMLQLLATLEDYEEKEGQRLTFDGMLSKIN